MAEIKEKKDSVAVQQQRKTFIDSLAQKGYPGRFLSAEFENLDNPNEDYVSYGFIDADGARQTTITVPKMQVLKLAEDILRRYRSVNKNE